MPIAAMDPSRDTVPGPPFTKLVSHFEKKQVTHNLGSDLTGTITWIQCPLGTTLPLQKNPTDKSRHLPPPGVSTMGANHISSSPSFLFYQSLLSWQLKARLTCLSRHTFLCNGMVLLPSLKATHLRSSTEF